MAAAKEIKFAGSGSRRIGFYCLDPLKSRLDLLPHQCSRFTLEQLGQERPTAPQGAVAKRKNRVLYCLCPGLVCDPNTGNIGGHVGQNKVDRLAPKGL